MSAARRVQCLAVCLGVLLGGCDRIGRSLVGYQEPFDAAPPLPRLPCIAPPACDADAGPPPTFVERTPGARDLSSCGAASNVPDYGLAELEALEGTVTECAGLRFVLEPGEAPAVVQLADLELDQVNVALVARAPIEIVLSEPSLRHSAFRLVGPVTLTILDARQAVDLGVVGQAVQGARPSLSIQGHALETATFGSSDEPFPGTVSLTRVAATTSQLVAERVELESVTYRNGLLEGAALIATDAELDTVELRVGEGQLAAGSLLDVNVTRCGTLSVLGVEGQNADFAACEPGPLRIYRSNLLYGFVDGRIESDVSGYTAVRFGHRAPTDLRVWTGGVMRVSFCDQAERLVLGGGARCSDCEGRAFSEPDALCRIEEADAGMPGVCPMSEPGAPCDGGTPERAPANFCPLLDEMPRCESLPERDRPLHKVN